MKKTRKERFSERERIRSSERKKIIIIVDVAEDDGRRQRLFFYSLFSLFLSRRGGKKNGFSFCSLFCCKERVRFFFSIALEDCTRLLSALVKKSRRARQKQRSKRTKKEQEVEQKRHLPKKKAMRKKVDSRVRAPSVFENAIVLLLILISFCFSRYGKKNDKQMREQDKEKAERMVLTSTSTTTTPTAQNKKKLQMLTSSLCSLILSPHKLFRSARSSSEA